MDDVRTMRLMEELFEQKSLSMDSSGLVTETHPCFTAVSSMLFVPFTAGTIISSAWVSGRMLADYRRRSPFGSTARAWNGEAV